MITLSCNSGRTAGGVKVKRVIDDTITSTTNIGQDRSYLDYNTSTSFSWEGSDGHCFKSACDHARHALCGHDLGSASCVGNYKHSYLIVIAGCKRVRRSKSYSLVFRINLLLLMVFLYSVVSYVHHVSLFLVALHMTI